MTTDVLTNGHHPQGRAVPDLEIFTFANGIVARLRPVSQFTQAHIEIGLRKKFPPPEAPLNAVDYGDGKTVQEPNYADPTYEQAKVEYGAMLSNKVFEAVAELALEIDIDRAALERVQTTMNAIGIPLEEISDKVAYIKHCCMFDIEHEGPKLASAIQALIGPREEDVADHIATFPDHVPGAGHLPDPRAALGGEIREPVRAGGGGALARAE